MAVARVFGRVDGAEVVMEQTQGDVYKRQTQYRDDYDTFYQMISAPEIKHRLVVPYAQKTLEFEAYVTKGKDSLQRLSLIHI